MESVVSYFADLGLNFPGLSKLACILLVGAILICGICRFIFRKKTMLGHAVSSSIAIIFVYVVAVLILVLAQNWSWLIAPLPFAALSEHSIRFFTFQNAGYPAVAAELLSMIILAFLLNLLDNWMPKGKNIFKWLFFRCVTVGMGFLAHYLVSWLLNRLLPQGILMYAPAILLGILVLMLLTGALKLLVGLFLTTINPLIAAFYTFFFANVVGRQVTQAVLTTGILSGVVVMLQKLNVTVLSLEPGALVAYIPFLLILIVVWYVVNKLL